MLLLKIFNKFCFMGVLNTATPFVNTFYKIWSTDHFLEFLYYTMFFLLLHQSNNSNALIIESNAYSSSEQQEKGFSYSSIVWTRHKTLLWSFPWWVIWVVVFLLLRWNTSNIWNTSVAILKISRPHKTFIFEGWMDYQTNQWFLLYFLFCNFLVRIFVQLINLKIFYEFPVCRQL